MSPYRWLPVASLVGFALVSSVPLAADDKSAVEALFQRAARDVAARTSIPVYIPVSLQSLEADGKDGCAFADFGSTAFSITLYGRITEYGKTGPLPCEANNAARIAHIHGDVKPMPDLTAQKSAQKVTLRNAAAGWFVPASCAGSCAPATLYWQTREASYFIQVSFGSKISVAQQREELLDTVNSVVLVVQGNRP
jgi:hypothetical protein